MALSRKNRLTGKKDIQNVFKEGKTVKNSFFFIKYVANSLDCARLAIIVSSKVSKKSVVRNRIRRIIGEIIIKNNFLSFPLDIIINASPIILDKSPAEIKSQLGQAIKKINVN